jgi:hypothetical protein
MRYGLGEAERAGLERFYELASEQGLSRKRPVAFFGGTDHQYASQRA